MTNKFLNIFIIALLGVFSIILCVSCGKSSSSKNKVIKVGLFTDSELQIWNPIVSNLEKEGITVEIILFADARMPNQALNDGEIDLNAFQHYAWLNEEVSQYGYDITAIADTYISAMNIYSQKISNINEVKMGDKIAIPNDSSGEGRALKVLQASGLIKLKDNAPDNPEVSDIAENPLNIKIVEVEAGSIYSLLPDVACAVINCNYALDFGLNPGADFIFQDNPRIYDNNMYVCLIASRTEDKDNEIYKKIVDAYHSPEVEKVYAEEFKGAYLPAWK